MKEKNFKLKSEKGITLIALILTIVLMLIIIGISVDTGMESLEKTKLQDFYTQLDLVQKKVDYIAATSKEYNELGSSLNSVQVNELNKIISTEGANLGLSVSNFRYFDAEQLESLLGLPNIKYNVFVDFKTRTVIAEKGLKINGDIHSILPKTVYHVEVNESKNEKWSIASLSYSIEEYGKIYYPIIGSGKNPINNTSGKNSVNNTSGKNTTSSTNSTSGKNSTTNSITDSIGNSVSYGELKNYLITVTPRNEIGEKMIGGILKYKKSTSNYWKTANGLEFVISQSGKYDVLYEDSNKNKIEKTVNINIENKIPYIKEIS